MITRTNHWKLINRWVAVGAICGLLWGTAVALLMTLSLATVAEGAAWVPLLMERTRIGACAGCFFGTVAGLILVVERLSISPATVSGRWGLFLLFVVVAWFGMGLLLVTAMIVPAIATVDWATVAIRYALLFKIGTIVVALLALPGLVWSSTRSRTAGQSDRAHWKLRTENWLL